MLASSSRVRKLEERVRALEVWAFHRIQGLTKEVREDMASEQDDVARLAADNVAFKIFIGQVQAYVAANPGTHAELEQALTDLESNIQAGTASLPNQPGPATT